VGNLPMEKVPMGETKNGGGTFPGHRQEKSCFNPKTRTVGGGGKSPGKPLEKRE